MRTHGSKRTRGRASPSLIARATVALALAFAGGAAALPGDGAEPGAPPAIAGQRVPEAPLTSADQLARAIDDHLLARLPGRTLRWELARPAPLPDRAGRRFRLEPPAVLTGGRNWFELIALDPPGATYLVPVDLAWQDSAWVAARALPAGRALAPGDAVRELCWHACAREALAGPRAIEGLRLAAAVGAGMPLLSSQLVCPPEIERGARVQLVCRRPGLLVSTPARALDEGWTGQEIRVQPIDSRQICTALVRSADEVEVLLP